LWVTTLNGISNIIVSMNADRDIGVTCKNYDLSNGLQGRQFNENAVCKMRSGELVIGGPNGFNLFFPGKRYGARVPPTPVLTDLQIFNNSIKPGEEYDGRVVLPQSIAGLKDITLKHNQDVFTLEFSALEFLQPDKIKYAYRLDGFSREWLTTDAKNRKATFTNLNSGTYTLLIKASNEDGEWSNEPLYLTIYVLPPFWLTPFAFVLYTLVVVSILLFARDRIVKRTKTKLMLEQERQEARRLHELDLMKIKFFTNVSHEFRTPLSLIISPIEKFLKDKQGGTNDKKQFQLIHRNARRLMNLVNQLLDFRKMEEQELKLNKTSADIVQFVREVSISFADIAENKNIRFQVQSAEDLVFTSFDHDKLERILFNLLSNAFKFTPEGGAITVKIEMLPAERTVQIKVRDTGIGIAKDKHEKIFERFFQDEIPGSMVNQGTGIGLAITKEFVRLHGGDITVESVEGMGSCFIVTLPILSIQIENEPVSTMEIAHNTGLDTELSFQPLALLTQETSARRKKKAVLLIEDSEDFRFYLKENLKSSYIIIEAPNGKIGWQKTLSEHPDLIVCDVNMPEMNGIDLCRKIKADKRTAAIPVILLTALTAEEQQIEGLHTGADDYITKPFNFEILLSKISNFLSQQDRFKKTYQKQVLVQSMEGKTEETHDQKFMTQLLEVVEKNISNPDFSVEGLSREMFMSRVALYKRIFSLTGKPPIEFIRTIRLQRAARLLKKRELTVAEVAYEVGFNTPKYFSRYFKMEYGVMPSEYAKQKEE
ncbi:MAG: hybrid sensor histidine kinase/response regulator transcription factor, partial [Chitinophagaceae bacterium]